jgi:hypothetical protein
LWRGSPWSMDCRDSLSGQCRPRSIPVSNKRRKARFARGSDSMGSPPAA